MHHACNLSGQKRWDGIADLHELFGPISQKHVIIGKGLKTRGFPDCQAAALLR